MRLPKADYSINLDPHVSSPGIARCAISSNFLRMTQGFCRALYPRFVSPFFSTLPPASPYPAPGGEFDLFPVGGIVLVKGDTIFFEG